jgi:hypothetical protein
MSAIKVVLPQWEKYAHANQWHGNKGTTKQVKVREEKQLNFGYIVYVNFKYIKSPTFSVYVLSHLI